jgi:hypothetical protein
MHPTPSQPKINPRPRPTPPKKKLNAQRESSHPDSNPAGNAFHETETDLTTTASAVRQAEPGAARVWRVKNPGRRHPVTGKPVAYHLYPAAVGFGLFVFGGGGAFVQVVWWRLGSVLGGAACHFYPSEGFGSLWEAKAPQNAPKTPQTPHPPKGPVLLAAPDSAVARRGRFTTAALHVTPHAEGQLYPAGYYVLQSTRDSGLAEWIKGVRGWFGGLDV